MSIGSIHDLENHKIMLQNHIRSLTIASTEMILAPIADPHVDIAIAHLELALRATMTEIEKYYG